MATLCGVCKRLIERDGEVCPYCGAASADPAQPDSHSNLDSLLESLLEESVSTQEESGSLPPHHTSADSNDDLSVGPDSSALFAPETDVEELDGFSVVGQHAPPVSAVARQDENTGKDTAEPSVEADEDMSEHLQPAGPVTPKRNALEATFDAVPREDYKSRVPRILIVFVVLSMLALFSAIVTLIVMPLMQTRNDKNEIVGFLEGTWISDKFAFYDSTSKSYVEVLTVDGDGNFTMTYAIPDDSYPEGWESGKWAVEDLIEGHIDFDSDGHRLLLLYEEDGGNYFFERFFISKDDDKICLREFYDEANENFYDVILYRVAA